MRKIPYGEINFETIINDNLLYIDKTNYIEKLEADVDLKKCFYLRPGRFGKSLFTNMLNYYYAIDTKEKFEKIFGNTYIGKHPTENRNKYYILKFDFSGMDVDSTTSLDFIREVFYKKVVNGIKDFANRYKIQIDFSDSITPADAIATLFIEFRAQKPDEKIYVLIDEYDNFTNGILKGDAGKFLDIVSGEGFVKAFYATIKENIGLGTVERFFATGIAPITLDSMTTGFNIATDITRYSEFVAMIGLTKQEVKEAIKEVLPEKTEQEQEEIYNEMEQYYNGYRFSEQSEERTVNTTLVMYYLKEYVRTGERPAEMLDINIAANFEKLENLITLKNNEYSKEVLEALMQKGDISAKIVNKFNLKMEVAQSTILSMLFYFGYCTIKENRTGLNVSFKIPNYVMEGIYNEYFMQLLAREGVKIDSRQMEDAILQLAEEGKIDKLCLLVEEYLSYIGNISWQRFDEKYVKSYMHAILYNTPIFSTYLEYNVKNNNYIDVAVFKVPSMGAKYQAIIEVKYIKKEDARGRKTREEAIAKKRDEAIEQIEAYCEDKRLPKDKMKKFIVVYVVERLELLEEVEI